MAFKDGRHHDHQVNDRFCVVAQQITCHVVCDVIFALVIRNDLEKKHSDWFAGKSLPASLQLGINYYFTIYVSQMD